MLLKRKKIVKTVNLKIWIFLFLYIFQKCLVDVRQSWSLFIEFRGFHFSSPSGFNAIHAFNMRFHVSPKAYRNDFASNFWQVAVCGIHMSKSFTGYHILLLELISLQKLQPPKHRQRQIVNYVLRIQTLHKLQYHRRFWYSLTCCILYSTKSKETQMKRSAIAHVSLKYRQAIFYSLLRAYWFPNNFNLNLVE